MKIAKIADVVATILVIAIFFSLVYMAAGVPEGASPSFVSSTSRNATNPTQTRSDDGGVIATVNLQGTVNQLKWKAYVGNVTGVLVLADGNGYSIYEWTLTSTITGDVFATRNNSISWDNISCARNDTISFEDDYLNHSPGASDNINNTFLNNQHTAFLVNSITLSNCPTLYPYVNNTAAASPSASNDFPIILIGANTTVGGNITNGTSGDALIYAVSIQLDKRGYNNISTYDFELVVADSASATGATAYYFYLELD